MVREENVSSKQTNWKSLLIKTYFFPAMKHFYLFWWFFFQEALYSLFLCWPQTWSHVVLKKCSHSKTEIMQFVLFFAVSVCLLEEQGLFCCDNELFWLLTLLASTNCFGSPDYPVLHLIPRFIYCISVNTKLWHSFNFIQSSRNRVWLVSPHVFFKSSFLDFKVEESTYDLKYRAEDKPLQIQVKCF